MQKRAPNMNKINCFELFSRLKKLNPSPTTELIYASNFELLIAVVLSAQATDVSVNKATKKLFLIIRWEILSIT